MIYELVVFLRNLMEVPEVIGLIPPRYPSALSTSLGDGVFLVDFGPDGQRRGQPALLASQAATHRAATRYPGRVSAVFLSINRA